MLDPDEAKRRIHAVVERYYQNFRDDVDRLLGSGPDHSRLGAVLVHVLLGQGAVFTVCGEPHHGILRQRFGRTLWDIDLYADRHGGDQPVRMAEQDELYDLVPLDLGTLTDDELDTLEAAVAASGPDDYASQLPKFRALRVAVERRRRR